MIYLHGFASGPTSSKARSFVRRFAAAGIALEVPQLDEDDFEHLTLSRMTQLVRARAPRVLIGSSLGGYVSVLHASKHPVDALILMAPAVDFHRRLVARYGPDALARWRREGFTEVDHYVHNRPMRLAADFLDDAGKQEPLPRVEVPTLVFQGRHDDVVAPDDVARWVDDQASAEVVMLDDDHSLTASIDVILERSLTFLARVPAVRERWPGLQAD